MKPQLLALVPALFLFGCDKTASKEPSDARAPEAAAPVVSASASASAAIVDAGDAPDGGKKILVLRWSAVKAGSGGPRLAVTLKAGAASINVGVLDATSDDPGSSGTPKACKTDKTSKSSSTFTCGGVPAYNYFTASLDKGDLVVRRVTGVDNEKGSEKTTEVKRMPVTESELRTLKFKPVTGTAAAPKCPAGQVPSDFTGQWRCAPQCTADTDCKDGTYCDIRRETTPDGKIGPILESACEKDEP